MKKLGHLKENLVAWREHHSLVFPDSLSLIQT